MILILDLSPEHIDFSLLKIPNTPKIAINRILPRLFKCKNKSFKPSRVFMKTTKQKNRPHMASWIYCLYQDSNLVYIGKTKNAPTTRITAHSKVKEFNFIRLFCIDRVHKPTLLHEIEKALIKKYKPIYNKTYLL